MTDDANNIGAVLEVLEQAASESGHVFLRASEMARRLERLGIDPVLALHAAKRDGFVVQRDGRVYLKHLDAAERDIAAAVREHLGWSQT